MRLPSIRRRLANALVGWSLVWSIALAAAVWLAAGHEIDELLDDTLHASSDVLETLLVDTGAASTPDIPVFHAPANRTERFAWQVIDAHGVMRLRSSSAPEEPLRSTPTAGFSDAPDWRIFGTALGHDGRMLYVAQTRAERHEAQGEVAASSALAALAIGLIGHLWLRARVRHELKPLETLSERLSRHDPLSGSHSLGPAEREELQPVQEAIDDLGQRLARRVANERAFAAHAAHALRTPLAGIDAQLAVAMREIPAEHRPRLQRVRDGAGRLQRVVAALLGLFRAGTELQRDTVDVVSLLARFPVDGLQVQIAPMASVDADPDLLAAALLNLLDNALRHGASEASVTVPRANVVCITDNGPGVGALQQQQLQAALDSQDYEGRTGLGLMLADRVARSHGGSLQLLDAAEGFAVELRLG